MIKKSVFALAFGMFLYSSAIFSFAQSFEIAKMGLIFNDTKLKLENPIIVSEGKSYISLREAIEKFPTERKIGISWKGDIQTVTLSISGDSASEKNIVKLKVGENSMTLNGFPLPLSDALVMYNDRTYFPVRSIARVLGFSVSWDSEKSAIKVVSPKGFK